MEFKDLKNIANSVRQKTVASHIPTPTKADVERNATIQRARVRASQIDRAIAECLYHLRTTDYLAIKYAEGELSAEEYAETRKQRRAWRAEINALEEELAALRNS